MNTLILTESDEDIKSAADIIKNGGLAVMPTETVYGLAADALNPEAVKKIFIAKGRAQDNPLIVHISDISQLDKLVEDVPEKAKILANAFWPGPLTMIMNKKDVIPKEVTCGMPTVAIRMPSHNTARKLIEFSGCPIAAPSANLSGGVSPTTAQHCIDDLSGRVDAIIKGGKCSVGLESTVILLTSNPPKLLRPGGITKEQIEKEIGHIDVDDAVLNPLKEGVAPSSPGMKYKHYSPKARVVVIDGNSKQYADYVNNHSGENTYALCFDEDIAAVSQNAFSYGSADDDNAQAALLFDMLRHFDDIGAELIYAHIPKNSGVGLAVLNRLLRAAGFEVIKL